MRSASSLVIADHDGATVSPGTLATITAAAKVGATTVLVAGNKPEKAAQHAASIAGVEKVLVADAPFLANGLAENIAACVVDVRAAKNFTHIFAPASNFGKNIIPRVAASLDVTALTEITAVHSEDAFSRPMYAGNVIAKVQSSEAVKVSNRPPVFTCGCCCLLASLPADVAFAAYLCVEAQACARACVRACVWLHACACPRTRLLHVPRSVRSARRACC
jgi:electron transfer flavoprotein alpha subunit